MTEPVFNVDRWTNYAWQKACMRAERSKMEWGNGVAWPRITPTQLRRMRKKARKNNDMSVDFLAVAFGVRS